MYLLFILIPLFIILICLNRRRRKKIICKVKNLCIDEKCRILDEILEPFGYCYILSGDFFSTRLNAWQRDMGYCALYDRTALRLNMVFDCLPIYFNYHDKTWLLEVWKGQYGINTGGEIGLYHADRLLIPKEREFTLFHAVDDSDLPKLSLALTRNGINIAQLTGRHWWLTAFRTGCFSHPKQLTVHAAVTFASSEMATAFLEGLLDTGYVADSICRHCNTISFSFRESPKEAGFLRRLRIKIAQWQNRFWCKTYLFITNPFCLAMDRVLYLYYYLPFAFRKTLRIRKQKK